MMQPEQAAQAEGAAAYRRELAEAVVKLPATMQVALPDSVVVAAGSAEAAARPCCRCRTTAAAT